MTRTEIRELTFELLYSLEIQKMEKEEYNEQIELFLVEQNISQEKAKTYMTETVNGIAKNKEKILELISQNLKEKWDISRVSKINLTLLKLATYEIMYTELPYKVVVNEAVEIAKKYEEQYPGIVKAVHQENGGHGQAVNTGLANATGVFFKVVDSDDWVDIKSYRKILTKLKEFVEKDDLPDMVIANYVYEKVGAKRKKVIHYENALPVDKMFGWDDMGHFKVDQYILMHSVIYRTQLIKDCGLELPKHTFYVDNVFVFEPLPYVKKMYYINTNFYRYFIGRDDQSVNEKVMISRIDQQLRVTRRLIDSYLSEKPENEKCRKYMRTYLRIMMEVSSIFLIISGTES